MFDKHGYVIFKGNVDVKGLEIHAQDRDTRTGLYPINLTIGNTTSRTQAFRDVEELREQFANISLWASDACRGRENSYTEEEQQVDRLSNSKRQEFYSCNLARFYIKEGTSDIERWHNKLGHVGTKIIQKCSIDGLKIPKTPFRCIHCIRGKMHAVITRQHLLGDKLT